MTDIFFKINGVAMPSPTLCGFLLTDLSSEESGRSSRTGKAYKDLVAQKRTLSPRWDRLHISEVNLIGQFFKRRGVLINVTYPDFIEGVVTKEFYTGDFSFDYDLWHGNNDYYVSNVSCKCIEV